MRRGRGSIQWSLYPPGLRSIQRSVPAGGWRRREEQVPVFGAGTCSERGRYVEYNLRGSLVASEEGEHPVFPVESDERLRGAGSRGHHGGLFFGRGFLALGEQAFGSRTRRHGQQIGNMNQRRMRVRHDLHKGGERHGQQQAQNAPQPTPEKQPDGGGDRADFHARANELGNENVGGNEMQGNNGGDDD